MKTPLLTVITATYNASENIKMLAESLLSQTCQNVQWIVQDGASRDETVKIVESYKDRLNISLVSEKDTGIYDAWNKALRRIEGEWVIFFGADDVFKDKKSVAKLSEFILQSEQEKKITAKTIFISSNIILGDSLLPTNADYRKIMETNSPFPYPGLLHRTNLFESYRYNPQYKIVGDYDFIVRILLADETAEVVFYPRIFCHMQEGGISNDYANAYQICKERVDVIKKYFGREIAVQEFTTLLQFAAARDRREDAAQKNKSEQVQTKVKKHKKLKKG